ncbi:hypothetical protein NL676_024896 [Syzygium grande]|nr:hypothetical protein NL676_024896 [Syzygium grande]
MGTVDYPPPPVIGDVFHMVEFDILYGGTMMGGGDGSFKRLNCVGRRAMFCSELMLRIACAVRGTDPQRGH